MDVSEELGQNVFAEESYLFDEIGQACHLEVRPHLACVRQTLAMARKCLRVPTLQELTADESRAVIEMPSSGRRSSDARSSSTAPN
jgi:hypothetical protein